MIGKFELARNAAATPSNAERAVADDFRGVTVDGGPISGLFPVKRTGISTRPIYEAAEAFLASLNGHQLRKIQYPVTTDEWRWWNNTSDNQHRSGLSFVEMSQAQKDLAFDVLRASLSAHGFETARNIMKLNETVAEITGRFSSYGEYCYWLTIMGTPSLAEPWGWQIDGHHCNLNFFVLGDQVVLSPAFIGSEPVVAETGKYAGTRILETEERQGLELIQGLGPSARGKALVSTQLPREVFTVAFRDNLVLDYEGVRFAELASSEQALMLRVLETWIGTLRPGHAEARLEEVRQHLGDTYFAWAGGGTSADTFYYRIQSPVIIIEFDYLPVVAFQRDRSVYPHAGEKREDYVYLRRPGGDVRVQGDTPYRQHIHAIIRTPNGNDYGNDLLRQHYEHVDHAVAATSA